MSETVTCEICGFQGACLTSHVTRIHEVSCEDYKNRYPGASLHSDSWRKHESEARKGKRFTEEHKRKLSKNHGKPWLGKHLSEEHKQKLSDAFKGRLSPTKGMTFSEETRRRMSESKKGQHLGENHWNWQGGKSYEPYSPEFNRNLKEQIRERDNHQCQICGAYQEERSNSLSVHHIDYDKQNNDPQNLVSLCDSCHSNTNFNRSYWTRHFTNMTTPLIQV